MSYMFFTATKWLLLQRGRRNWARGLFKLYTLEIRANDSSNILLLRPKRTETKAVTLLGNTVYFSKKGKSNWVRYSSPMLLNTNSVKNKYDELKRLNNEIKSHIIFISETKIDSSYPNGQFALSSYTLYHPTEVERKEMWTQRTLWL